MALNLYNPFTRISQLEQELANLRQANQRMKDERDKYRLQVEGLQANLNTALDDLVEIRDAAESCLDAMDPVGDLREDRSMKRWTGPSNMELAS